MIGYLILKKEEFLIQRENVRIRCKEIDNEAEVNRGYILCSNDNFFVFNVFEAEIQVLGLKEK